MVSCWHLSGHESMAMWKIYAPGGKAIAIQSTFEALRQAVSHIVVGVGLVKYVDHETGRTHVRTSLLLTLHAQAALAQLRK